MFHGRQVIVDDMHDITDVNTTGAHSGGDENRSVPRAEGTHGILALILGSVGMHRSDRQAGVVQEVVEVVSFTAAVHKNDGANTVHFLENLEQKVSLLTALSLMHYLLDVRSSTSDTADTEADMVGRQVLLGEVSGLLGEGGREEAKLDVASVLFYKRRLA